MKRPPSKGKRNKKRAIRTLSISQDPQSAVEPMLYGDAIDLCRRYFESPTPGYAEHIARQILDQLPGDLNATILLANYYLHAHQLKLALDYANAALQHDARNFGALSIKSDILYRLTRVDEAAQITKKLISIQPNNDVLHDKMGVLLAAGGKTKPALACYDRAIALNAGSASSYWNKAVLDANSLTGEDIDAIKKLLDSGSLHYEHQAVLNMALARTCQANGDREKEFQYLHRGNACIAGHQPWSQSAAAEQIAAIQAAVNSDLIATLKTKKPLKDESMNNGPTSAAVDTVPIFLCCLPRSGSTLLERILAAHPEISGCGETAFTRMAINSTPEAQRERCDIWQWRSRDNVLSGIMRLQNHYMQHLSMRDVANRHFVDKTIDNELFVGYQLLAFEQAKIVYIKRDPLDTALSNYQWFLGGQGLEYIYRLDWFAHRYQLHCQLMAYWQSLFPDNIHVVDYQDLVASPRQHIENLLSYLGLPWDDACLDFHQTAGNVITASQSQVRQSLNSASVGRWKPYAQYLQPVAEILDIDISAHISKK